MSELHPSLPAAEYHVREALSSSGCEAILRSPAHFRVTRDAPKEPTAAMQFGTVVHSGVLEPDAISTYAVAPNVDKRTKSGKETWSAFEKHHVGKIILTAEDEARALACMKAVREHPGARKLLDGGQREWSLFWQDGQYKVPCKARLDNWHLGGITDLKTAQDASRDGFRRSMANYLYHLQGAWYMNAAEAVLNETPRFFCFVVVETEPPHAVACYRLGTASLLAGRHLADQALQRYAAALASGQWAAYPNTIETLDVPRWALRFEDEP